MTEEAAELAEQEEMMRQERGLRDMQAQQQAEDARFQAIAQAAGEREDAEEEERNLDDDIPEGEASAEDVTFNEDSMVEGSHLVDQEQYAMEEAELTGAARDEEELGIEHERDLDNSVPEAGSYQHTDTEVEDSTSEEESELQDSFAAQSARRGQTQIGVVPMIGPLQGGLQERMRAQAGGEALPRSPGSLNLSSSLLENSFVGSSPVVQRGGARNGNARGGRLS